MSDALPVVNQPGKIMDCASAGCGWRCCEFQQGNYIVTYPGEYEKAIEDGQGVDHLEVTDDDYNGGKKMICKASRTIDCDGGFKPLDCQTYPFFPMVSPGLKQGDPPVIAGAVKGVKCPLTLPQSFSHGVTQLNVWRTLAEANPAIARWLAKVELVGYAEIST